MEGLSSRYSIGEKLGEGGMGVVYLAEDTTLGRKVAIKFATPGADRELHERLLKEARAASALNHPHIAAVYDCGIMNGRPYVVMELVRGRTLAETLADGPLPVQQAVEIVTQVLDALDEAHRHGVIHRDIKPSNIILNGRGHVKVLDFGLAKQMPLAAAAGAAATMSVEGALVGTPAYMPPEQARGGAADPRADLFSTGAVLYECLTGRRAFAGSTALDVLAQVLECEPLPASSVNAAAPAALDRVVSKALAKNPDARYESAAAMLADLRPFVAAPAVAPAPRRANRRPLIAALLALAVLAPVAVWYLTRAPLQPSPSALRFYEEGVNAIRDGTYYKAAQTLQQAARLDSRYPLTHARLAEAWNELDYMDRAREAMLAAMPPGESTPNVSSTDLTRLRAIRRVLTRDLSGAAEAYRNLARQLPREEQASAFVDLGRVHEKSEKLKDALAAFDTAADLEPRYAAAFLRMGSVYRRLEDAPHAEEAFGRAESLYAALSNVEGLTEVAYQRSVMANQLGQLDDARALLGRALSMAETGGSQHQRIKILLQLHSVWYRQGNTEEARRYATEALESARRHSLPDLITRGLTELGINAQIRGDAPEARRYFAEAIESARRHHGLNSEARARFSLASFRIDLGETDAAFDDLAKVLSFYQSGGYRSQTSSCALLLVRLKRKKGDFSGALRSAREELEAARAAGNAIQEGYALGEIGRALQEQERYAEALAAYREMRETGAARGNRFTMRYAAADAAETLWRAGKAADARASAAEAEKLNGTGGDRALMAQLEFLRAEMALAAGQFGAARAGADRALALKPDDRELAASAAVLKGRAGQGQTLTARGLEMARALKNTRLTVNALLAHAEALIEAREPAAALGAAGEAASLAAAGGLTESEWRASSLAAAAALAVGDRAQAEKHAETARAAFDRLPQAIGPGEFNTWLARPDIRRLRTQWANGGTR